MKILYNINNMPGCDKHLSEVFLLSINLFVLYSVWTRHTSGTRATTNRPDSKTRITCRTNMAVYNDWNLLAVINVVHSTSLEKSCEGDSCVCLWWLIHPVCRCYAPVKFVFKELLCWSEDNRILLDKRLQRSWENMAKWGSRFFQTQLDHDQLSSDWALINQSFVFQSVFTPKDKNRFPLCAVHDKFITLLPGLVLLANFW